MQWPSRPRLHARVLRDPLPACLGFPRPMALGRPWGSLPMDPHPATRFASPALYSGLQVMGAQYILNDLEDIWLFLASDWCLIHQS